MSVGSERVRLVATGWDQALVHEGWTPPEPGADEVLVAVEACGVCYRDLIDREGRFPFLQLPITPGHEAAGRVAAVGAAVREWKVGDRVGTMHRDACGQCDRCAAGETSLCQGAGRVFGILVDGGYAGRLIAAASALYSLPEGIGAKEAAVLHCTFGTAYRDLKTLGGLRAAERVLITGANGGVGSAAVQIARRLGAEVIAVVRDGRHRAWLEGLGAARVIVDGEGRFHDEAAMSVDLALDTVGKATFNPALRSLRIGGRIVVVGNIVAERAALNLGYVITNGLTIIGGSGATRRDMAEVLALHREREFEVVIDRALPLARAEEAQRAVRAGGLRGRVVLVPGGA